MKCLKYFASLDFSFKRYTQHNLVWSSIKVMNHLVPEILVILDGPQISLWIIEKDLDDLYGCEKKETQVCLEI